MFSTFPAIVLEILHVISFYWNLLTWSCRSETCPSQVFCCFCSFSVCSSSVRLSVLTHLFSTSLGMQKNIFLHILLRCIFTLLKGERVGAQTLEVSKSSPNRCQIFCISKVSKLEYYEIMKEKFRKQGIPQ